MPESTETPFTDLGQGSSSNEQDSTPLEAFLNDDEDDSAIALRVRKTVSEAMGAVRAQRAEMREADRQYHGHQWEDYDKMVMQQSRRPALTFNEIKKFVNAICGLERLNRTDVHFVSRPLDSDPMLDAAGDLASEAVGTVDELCDAAYERSMAVLDCAIGGLGFFECKVDFDEEIDGKIIKEHINKMEMIWDTHARRVGLADRRWIARQRNMPRSIFERRWPDKLDLVQAAAPEPSEWSIQKYELVTPYYSLANQQANPQVGEAFASKNTLPVIQFQEKFDVSVYRLADPDSDKLLELSEKSWKSLKEEFEEENLPIPPSVRQTKTIYRQMYVCNGVLLEKPVILPGNHFSLMVTTGMWDEEKKVWYGIVRDMIDPQKTKNKALSTALYFYLANAKGGVMFEQDTFVNPAQAKEQWSQPNPWIELREGGLKKLEQRKPTDLPAALTAFYEIGGKGIYDVSGLSQELLGMAQGEASSPTQRSRLLGSLAVLGCFFDEINRFRKEEARVTLEFVREFWTNGQLITVGGPFNAKSIPLLKNKLPMDYTLQVDESLKHNPNLKSQIWNDLQPMIPALLKFGAGRALLYLLKLSPLPAWAVSAIQRDIMQNPPQGPQGRGGKTSPEEQAAKARKLSADAEKSIAQAKEIDEKGQFKVAEIVLDALSLDADTRNKESVAEHRKQVDAVKMMKMLLPGAKGAG